MSKSTIEKSIQQIILNGGSAENILRSNCLGCKANKGNLETGYLSCLLGYKQSNGKLLVVDKVMAIPIPHSSTNCPKPTTRYFFDKCIRDRNSKNSFKL